jgi:four helix bundle protein
MKRVISKSESQMEDFVYARNFRELLVYKQAFIVSRRIFEVSKGFPEDEKYALTSQIRRASRSIGANITEASAKRKYERHFVSKLTDADGEQMETQHWTRVAFSCRYLEESTARSLVADLEQVGRLLQGMMDKAESFCSVPRIAEDSPPAESVDSEDPLTPDW